MKAESVAARLALAAAVVGGVGYLAADHLTDLAVIGEGWPGRAPAWASWRSMRRSWRQELARTAGCWSR